ncbi:Ig-like domain-containing protein [Bacterioplanoides sp. SCSIO 12839]|uniref:Ig-like domain-containing protein n=1 Tax=Bacterioplanoides sp. SCSIO 12839 TaxID=2829569 RepID=UPI002106A948|nr:Ig-like domain-containing protein [Bacterioplanoides sp. SCSIO 12839]UTW48536.1 Ig-like domain-containing protein [Bacterioplanoides sp. SCSIO 12839]
MKTALLTTSWFMLFLMTAMTQAESNLTSAKQCQDGSQLVQVSAVYPTADTLPENLLRFYIYFSEPMETENTLSHIHLKNDQGKKLEGVFLENKLSLWSPDRTRLTLLFDPGRVKTGLVAHNAYGRALTPGSTYHLSIDAAAINQLGCSSEYIKTFTVTEADYDKPDLSNWVISSPNTETRENLMIDFNAPIDHVSLAYRIRVKDSNNKSVAGSIDLGTNEQQWIFSPIKSWQNNIQYKVVVDPVLEDIAGNRITGLFDQPSLREESKFQNQKIEIPIMLK